MDQIALQLIAIVGSFVGATVVMLKFFMKWVEKKDVQVEKKDETILGLVANFNKTVNNHISHSEQASIENTKIVKKAVDLLNSMHKRQEVLDVDMKKVLEDSARLSHQQSKLVDKAISKLEEK